MHIEPVKMMTMMMTSGVSVLVMEVVFLGRKTAELAVSCPQGHVRDGGSWDAGYIP